MPTISQTLFFGDPINGYKLNSAPFGELFIITQQLVLEPINTQFWMNIHPRIAQIAKELFCDGHFASATEKATKELEARLRELFVELKPSAGVPAKIGEIVGALLGDNGAFNFSDTSTVSGKDYRRGIKLLFDGIFSAYRNPAAHANLPCTKREAIEQITLSRVCFKTGRMPDRGRFFRQTRRLDAGILTDFKSNQRSPGGKRCLKTAF